MLSLTIHLSLSIVPCWRGNKGLNWLLGDKAKTHVHNDPWFPTHPPRPMGQPAGPGEMIISRPVIDLSGVSMKHLSHGRQTSAVTRSTMDLAIDLTEWTNGWMVEVREIVDRILERETWSRKGNDWLETSQEGIQLRWFEYQFEHGSNGERVVCWYSWLHTWGEWMDWISHHP